MQNSFRFDVKTRWLLLATSALVIYTVVPIRRGALYDLNAVSTWLQFLLFVLTFPLGSFFVLFVHAFAGGFGEFGIVEQFQMWIVAVALGFLQWFFLIPAMLRHKSSEVTALHLSSGGDDPAVASAQTGGALPEVDTNVATNASPIPQFDERGRTPFERILNSDDESNKTH
ncbi:MAG TPA: hypothetical protein VF240_04780 [Pyrinomonadaceae bacterium]